jgi:YHS domain-containing protein
MRWPVEHAGRTYRFCDPNCRAAFESNPEKFLKDPKFNPVDGGSGTK